MFSGRLTIALNKLHWQEALRCAYFSACSSLIFSVGAWIASFITHNKVVSRSPGADFVSKKNPPPKKSKFYQTDSPCGPVMENENHVNFPYVSSSRKAKAGHVWDCLPYLISRDLRYDCCVWAHHSVHAAKVKSYSCSYYICIVSMTACTELQSCDTEMLTAATSVN